MAKATSLAKAYREGAIPSEGGYIVSAFFMPGTTYAVYEITSYGNVKDVNYSEDHLIFRTDGSRTHALVESPTYPKKHVEPVHRDEGESIPYRFDDMTIIKGQKSERIMIPPEPVPLHTTFTVLVKHDDFFSFLFYPTADVYPAIRKFIADSFYNDCNMSKPDARDASQKVFETINKFTVWEK